MTDAERAEILSRELDGAFRNRADLYRLFFDQLSRELGEERAEEIMTHAITRRGQEVAEAAFAKFGPNDAKAVGEAFLAVSPDGGRMYPTEVERGDAHIEFRVKRCPLKDAWVAAGVGDKHLATLCRMAGAFDRGLFEAIGVHFDNVTWTPGHGSDCCHIRLTDRDAARA